VTVNGYVAVPFWSIEPVNVSVVSVAVVVVVGVVTVEALEEDPQPASQNSDTIENARLQGRTTRAVNFMNLSLVQAQGCRWRGRRHASAALAATM